MTTSGPSKRKLDDCSYGEWRLWGVETGAQSKMPPACISFSIIRPLNLTLINLIKFGNSPKTANQNQTRKTLSRILFPQQFKTPRDSTKRLVPSTEDRSPHSLIEVDRCSSRIRHIANDGVPNLRFGRSSSFKSCLRVDIPTAGLGLKKPLFSPLQLICLSSLATCLAVEPAR